jgi:hypothetical protein
VRRSHRAGRDNNVGQCSFSCCREFFPPILVLIRVACEKKGYATLPGLIQVSSLPLIGCPSPRGHLNHTLNTLEATLLRMHLDEASSSNLFTTTNPFVVLFAFVCHVRVLACSSPLRSCGSPCSRYGIAAAAVVILPVSGCRRSACYGCRCRSTCFGCRRQYCMLFRMPPWVLHVVTDAAVNSACRHGCRRQFCMLFRMPPSIMHVV